MFDRPGYKNVLLTGQPGCGKSTLLNNIIQQVHDKEGILTKQILDEEGQRTGFEIEYSGKCTFPLASKTKATPYLFANKWYIQTAGLKSIIENTGRNIGTLLYLDEIAPMQLYVPEFAHFTNRLLNSNNPVLGTIKQDSLGYNFINQVKSRKDCLILTLNNTTRPSVERFLQVLVQKIKKSQLYIQEPRRYKKATTRNVIMHSQHGERILHHNKKAIYCDCLFYAKYQTCSHSIALRQIYSTL